LESEPYQTIAAIISVSGAFSSPFGIVLGVFVVILLLLVSAIMSGSEVAYFSLSPGDIKKLAESKSRLSRMVISHLQTPERLLANILVTNNFVNVGIVVTSTFITNGIFRFTGPVWLSLLIQVASVTFLILFFSEVLPKIYANRFSVSIARFTAPVLSIFSKIFWPVITSLIYSTSIIQRRIIKRSHNISIDELSDALEITEKHLTEEKNILKGIVKFGNIDVCDIMKSRVDTVAVDIDTPFDELIKLIEESGYSRIPVYEENFDQVRGILYIKDLLAHFNKPADFKWQSLIRPTYFVPESKKINDLLKEFQTNHIHMAVVIDEYGGTSGIITLEDILEEIVGEISDESDEDEITYEKIDESNFIFEGKTHLTDFYKLVGIDDTIFDTIKGEADTIAGLILELKGEIPKPEDQLLFKNFVFNILTADKRRIKKIKVTIKPSNEDSHGKSEKKS
jgi:putative hemolysin